MERFLKHLFNVPNTLSLIRVLLAPFLAVFWLTLNWYEAALAIGTIVGITDLLDGVLARKLNQITELGALLDQLGDLVFEATGLLIAVLIGDLSYGVFILYLFREFTVMVIRAYVVGKGGTLPSSLLGKAKSSFIQYAFFLFFFGEILIRRNLVPADWNLIGIHPGQYLIWSGTIAIVVGIGAGVVSGGRYLKAFGVFYTEQVR